MGENVVSKMLMHDYEGGRGWLCDEISKQVLLQSEIDFKTKNKK